MVRRSFVFPSSDYREITGADAIKSFTNELFPDGNVLSDLIPMNVDNGYVFVYDENNEILAFMLFYDNDSYFYVEFLATNRNFRSGLRPSTRLITLLGELGKHLKYERIELWALEDQIPLYRDLGFHEIGITEIGNYGAMSKMVKSLS